MSNCENESQDESLATMRGVLSFNYNGTTIFVKASVEEVANVLSSERGASQWQKDVVNQEVELSKQCFFVFRFNGHTWTNIIARDHLVVELLEDSEANNWSQDVFQQKVQEAHRIELNEDDARLLSLHLKTRAIYYRISDTAMALGYRIYENGELLEKLKTGECYEDLKWESTIHDISAEQIEEDVEAWVEKLFTEHDVLEPSIHFTRWVGYVMHKPGHKVTTPDSNNVFERVDFVAL